jgi:phosphate transport system permease protein
MSVALTTDSTVPPDDDTPRRIVARQALGDQIFRGILRAAGIAVLVITAMILIFLVIRSWPAWHQMGLRFFTTSTLVYADKQFGVAALLPDSVVIALIALVFAFPAGLAAALYISEYAPPRLRRPLIAVIDLLAAIPSIAFALWGLVYLMPKIYGTDTWLARHLGFLPFFHFTQTYSPSNFVGSEFIGGLVVSMMVIPIIASLSRQVFSQAPQGEREAAYALGATRWGMVRTVVLPFGRAGVIGASMLGLGRALGETIAVSFILSPPTQLFSYHVLDSGGNSITASIANLLGSYSPLGISYLLAAALTLFLLTLIINTLASIVINRSRSGAATEAD